MHNEPPTFSEFREYGVWNLEFSPFKIQNFLRGDLTVEVQTMRRSKYILAGSALLLVAHHDFWNWASTSLYLGIPLGLVFHLLLCVAASALFTLLVLVGGRSHPQPRHRLHKRDGP